MCETKKEIPEWLKKWKDKNITWEEARRQRLCFRAFTGECLGGNCAGWMDYICFWDVKSNMTPYSVGARLVEE